MFVVGGIEWVFELARQEVAIVFGGEFVRHLDPVFVAVGRKQDQRCSEMLDDFAAFAACSFGHNNRYAIAAGGSYHGKGDARIAARAFKDDGIGSQ